jgi:hypothetical protein
MNRIYQGRVARVEIPDGKGGWQLLGFKPDKAEQLEKERERLRLLTKKNDAKGWLLSQLFPFSKGGKNPLAIAGTTQ